MADEDKAAVWTVGHSNRPVEELIELLRSNEIELLVDVRTVPRSRHNPQFNRDVLPDTLAAVGIDYEHASELGGLRKTSSASLNTGWRNASFRGYADHMQTDRFRDAVGRLADEARNRRLALMCAEAVPWRCHRSLIGDALLVRGIEVRHVLGPRPASRHELTSFARVEGLRITYPGLV